jgi:hypothetical protein
MIAPFRVAAAGVLAMACTSPAQELAPKPRPGDFGLLVPDGPSQPGDGRRVVVKDASDNLVVGQVHIEVGGRYIVLLPNGRLISVPHAEATITDRPFEPATKEQLAEELKGLFQGFKTRSTRRYVYVYNASEPFYKATSTILETMYPALYEYCRRQKLPVKDPQTPLVVVMFRTEEEFDKFRSMPGGVVAYYNIVTNHVVMFEQSRLGEIAPELAVKQAISTIAHEGVHQILHNIGVQQRLSNWPTWLSEGLPEYFAPTQTDKGVRWKGIGVVNDLRQYSLQRMLEQGRSEPAGKLVEQTVQAQQLTSDGYAMAWALTHYLANRQQAAFFDYLREVSSLQPLDGERDDNLSLFQQHFGDDLAELEVNLLKHLAKLPYVDPIANQTHYVAMLNTGLRRSVMISTSPAAVRRWQEEQSGQIPPSDRGRARWQLQALPSKAAAESFANSWLSGR